MVRASEYSSVTTFPRRGWHEPHCSWWASGILHLVMETLHCQRRMLIWSRQPFGVFSKTKFLGSTKLVWIPMDILIAPHSFAYICIANGAIATHSDKIHDENVAPDCLQYQFDGHQRSGDCNSLWLAPQKIRFKIIDSRSVDMIQLAVLGATSEWPNCLKRRKNKQELQKAV